MSNFKRAHAHTTPHTHAHSHAHARIYTYTYTYTYTHSDSHSYKPVLSGAHGWIDGAGYELLTFVLRAFKVNVVLVMGHDRLYQQLLKTCTTMASEGKCASACVCILRLRVCVIECACVRVTICDS